MKFFPDSPDLPVIFPIEFLIPFQGFAKFVNISLLVSVEARIK